MDGTALSSRGFLSDLSLATLRDLADRGVEVAFCSGRSAPAIQDHAASLALAGVFLLGLGLVFFPAVLYGAVLSKLLPEAPPDAWLRRAVRDDHYYCLLVPLSIGMLIPKTVVQWVCAKLYKHAYL